MTRPTGAGRPGSGFVPDMLTALLRDPLDPAYQDAARRKAAGPPPSRAAGAAGRTLGLLTVAVVGFLLAVAYQQVVAAEPESARTRTGLVNEVRLRQAGTDELSQRAEQLRDEVDRQRAEAFAGDEFSQLRNLAAAAGLARVHGDGVTIEVRDAPEARDPVTGLPTGNDDGRIRDRDLQMIANALWAGGAEAIAINGQRLSSTSTIRAVGSAILVDFKPVRSPYRVAAIGPDTMERAYNDSPTGLLFRQLAKRHHVGLSVRKQDDLTLAAATEPHLRYARPPDDAPSPTPAAPLGSSSPSPVPSTPGGR